MVFSNFMRVGIALGSNLEDRLQLLRSARDQIRQLHNLDAPFLCSRIYETRPIGCPPDSPLFLNAAIELSSTMSPLDILHHLQRIESALGRPAQHIFHAPRTIDLDLLYCDNLKISHDTLTLPHPSIAERDFVLRPLVDICPDRILPNQVRTIRELMQILQNTAEMDTMTCNIYTF